MVRTRYLSTSLTLLMHAMWSSHTSRRRSRKSWPAAAVATLSPLPVAPLPLAPTTEVACGKTGTTLARVSDSRCDEMSSATALYSW